MAIFERLLFRLLFVLTVALATVKPVVALTNYQPVTQQGLTVSEVTSDSICLPVFRTEQVPSELTGICELSLSAFPIESSWIPRDVVVGPYHDSSDVIHRFSHRSLIDLSIRLQI